jgi:hypothetical protein
MKMMSSPVQDILTPSQEALHKNFQVSIKALKTAWLRTIFYLTAIQELKIHRLLGYRSIGEYAQSVAGFTPRMTSELLQLARQLQDFPLVAKAFDEGRLTWNQAREICSRTHPDDQEHWLETAGKVSRQALREAMARAAVEKAAKEKLEKEKAPGQKPGHQDRRKTPTSGSRPRRQHRTPPVLGNQLAARWSGGFGYVTFKFTAEQMARYERLVEHLRKSGAASKEEALLNAMSCPGETFTPPPYLVVIMKCPTCGKSAIPTGNGEAPADRALLKAARCDAVIEDEEANRRSIVPDRLRRLAFQRARFTCQAQGCGSTRFLEIHHRTPVALGGRHTPDNLVVLCHRCHRALHEADEAARAAGTGEPE